MTGPSAGVADASLAITFAIFDVDGVLLDSPHEQAWRAALQGIAAPDRFTTAIYQANVAGKPRLDGAIAALRALGVPDAKAKAPAYAAAKQTRLMGLVRAGKVRALPDALRFVAALRTLAIPMAAASSSKNASAMMRSIKIDGEQTLLDLFDVNDCGRDLTHGKPDPEIFLLAAKLLGAEARHCLVVEDSPSGVEAAKAAGVGPSAWRVSTTRPGSAPRGRLSS